MDVIPDAMPIRFLRTAAVVLLAQETVAFSMQPRMPLSPSRAGGVTMALAPEGFVWSEVPEVRRWNRKASGHAYSR